MRWFVNASISTKLSVLSSLAVSVALTLGFTAFLYFDVEAFAKAKRQNLRSMAMLLGANTVSAIEFNDPASAAETLASLSSQPTVELAALYDADGKLFATYPVDLPPAVRIPDSIPHFEHLDQVSSDRSFIEVVYPVGHSRHPSGASPMDLERLLEFDSKLRRTSSKTSNGEFATTEVLSSPYQSALGHEYIGHILIRASTADIRQGILDRARSAAIVLVISLAAGLIISRWFQKVITRPINDLVMTMRSISDRQDFSERAVRYGDDEIGVLCDNFNGMLGELQLGSDKLQQAHGELEQRVIERTAELKRAMKEALAASQAKSDFLANMSHEIRTPMTAILGYADLLNEDDATPLEKSDRIDAIQRNSTHLLEIINDVLDVSKIEAGKMTVERIQCSVGKIVADMLSLLRRRATEKGLTLEVEYQGQIPAQICTDPTRLRQILINLLGNAIKFTDQGGIKLVVSMAPQTNDANSRIQFEVIDTGIGLMPEQLATIFQAFTQADESMTRRYGGTGLGLTISRGLASLLGGTIDVKSNSGEGTNFSVTVDTGPLDGVRMFSNCCESIQGDVSEATIENQKRNDNQKIDGRILLVEDGMDNQRLISFLLRSAGAEVSVAENGKVGLNMALAAWQQGTPFHLVFMDMQMPVMDGYAATTQLREEEYPFPIVALTAHAMSHERNKCLAVGCDEYFTKPVNRANLIAVAAKWIEQSKISLSEAAPC